MRTAARRPVNKRQPVSRSVPLPAPTLGWVTNETLARSKPGAARILENWFPQKTGVRIRGGSQRHATITGPVVSMFSYDFAGDQHMFAASSSLIWDVTQPTDAEAVESAVLGVGGHVSAQTFTTAGGNFLVACFGDGVTPLHLFNGTDWFPLSSGTTYSLVVEGLTGAFTGTMTGDTSTETATIASSVALGGDLWRVVITSPSGSFTTDEPMTASGGGTATMVGNVLSSPVNIAGVSTAALSQVWSYASRLWFVEKDTMKVWYLPTDAIGGTATSINLGSVFSGGGSVLFGAMWSSSDQGDGLDSRAIFVTTNGEVAVYVGTDPSSASTWSREGVYKIPPPMGKKAFCRVAGDVLILTVEGLVSVSEATQKDPAALSLSAVSRQIEPSWRETAATRASVPWEMAKWDEGNMGLVATPTSNPDAAGRQCFAVNLETGAWAKFVGWDARCFEVLAGAAYFGTNDGTVLLCDSGGTDDGQPYECRMMYHPTDLGASAVYKSVMMARGTFMSDATPSVAISVAVDYDETFQLTGGSLSPSLVAYWGSGIWGSSTWYSDPAPYARTEWVSVGLSGFSVSPQLHVVSADPRETQLELLGLDLLYQVGLPVV